VTVEQGSWDHMALIDPASSAWALVRRWLAGRAAGASPG
jgi:hypothetical protein